MWFFHVKAWTTDYLRRNIYILKIKIGVFRELFQKWLLERVFLKHLEMLFQIRELVGIAPATILLAVFYQFSNYFDWIPDWINERFRFLSEFNFLRPWSSVDHETQTKFKKRKIGRGKLTPFQKKSSTIRYILISQM